MSTLSERSDALLPSAAFVDRTSAIDAWCILVGVAEAIATRGDTFLLEHLERAADKTRALEERWS